MTILIRLNKGKDDDLIYLHEHTDFSFQKNVKMILSAYLQGQNISIAFPVIKDAQVTNKQHHQIHISFNEKKDPLLVQFLSKNVPSKKRSTFLKNVLRSSLAGTYLPEEFSHDKTLIDQQNELNKKIALSTNAVPYLTKKASKKKSTDKKTDIVNKEVVNNKDKDIVKVNSQPEEKPVKEETPVKEAVPVKKEEPLKEEPSISNDDNSKEEVDDGGDMFDIFSKMIDDSYAMAAKK